MQLLRRFGLAVFAVSGIVFTYLPLYLSEQDRKMLGLPWQYNFIIGITVLFIAIAVVLVNLYLKYRRLTDTDAMLRREMVQDGVKALKSGSEALALLVDELRNRKDQREGPLV
jgi:uncharacterized membrane protein YhaH (DUF805 family)